jgi:regulatory protein
MGEARSSGRSKRPRPPLDDETLHALALHYVGKYATTRARLADYLRRKVRERGWEGDRPPQIGDLAQNFAAQGYLDDAGYALMKSRSLTGRGYGVVRVRQSLRSAGVTDDDGEQALDLARSEAAEAALRFARRRRIGPYALQVPDPKTRDKALAAMVRAGHSFDLAKAILAFEPGSEPDLTELAGQTG